MVVPLEVPTGDAVLDLIPRLLAGLHGDGPVALPFPVGGHRPPAVALTAGEDDPADPTALAVSTSGSTGEAKQVLLPAGAIRQSAIAGQARLHDGDPGSWLLCLPVQHIAGLNVLFRAALAGREPVVMDVAQTFTTTAFAAATQRLRVGPAFVSLVPTQLHRLLTDPVGIEALSRFTAVLVGGAATGPILLDRARHAGVSIVTSYGMSETCGGCVYDGRPLDGVLVDLDDSGRIRIAGTIVARGYRGRPFESPFGVDPLTGRRSFVTGDLGSLDRQRLAVLGRADDVIITGGVNIAPQAVEQALADAPGVVEVVVTSVTDPEWGEMLVAVVVSDGVPPTLADLRARATRVVGPAAAPKQLLLVDALPARGPGKPDRNAIAALAAEAVRRELR